MNLSSKKRTSLILIVLYAITALIGIYFVLNANTSTIHSINDSTSNTDQKTEKKEPTADESVIDKLDINESAVNESAVDTPTIDTPTIDTPTIDTPAVDVPVVDTPAIDTPSSDIPTVDEELPTSDAPTEDASQTTFSFTSMVNIRAAADINSQILGVSQQGGEGILLIYDEEWSYVQVNKIYGYVSTPYISIKD